MKAGGANSRGSTTENTAEYPPPPKKRNTDRAWKQLSKMGYMKLRKRLESSQLSYFLNMKY